MKNINLTITAILILLSVTSHAQLRMPDGYKLKSMREANKEQPEQFEYQSNAPRTFSMESCIVTKGISSYPLLVNAPLQFQIQSMLYSTQLSAYSMHIVKSITNTNIYSRNGHTCKCVF